jgi:hypothetical protein
VEYWNDVDNWKKLTNSRNRVRKKKFCFSNCHLIGLDTGGLGRSSVSCLLLEPRLEHSTGVNMRFFNTTPNHNSF